MRPFKKDSLDKYDYEYYEDSEGKIRKVRKMEYQPRSGYIRIKFLDKLWVKWRRSSYDSKLLYLPWMLGYISLTQICHLLRHLQVQHDVQPERD